LLAQPDNEPRWSVAAASSGIARRAAHAHWRAEQLKYIAKTGGVKARDATSRVTSAKPLRHIFDRYCHLPAALPRLGKGAVQLSAYGAGGATVLGASSAPIRAALWVHRARLGRTGLFTAPVWRAPPKGSPELAGDAFRAIYKETACDLCGGGRGDAAHFATVCRHPVMAARRAAALGGGKFVAAVGALADALADGVDGGVPPQAFTEALAALVPESPEGIFIAGNLLTAVAWTHASVPDDWAVAARLGRYFDRAVPAADVAAACTLWIKGAARILRVLCRDWCFLIGARRLKALEKKGFRLPRPRRENGDDDD
jgi:hypothetical protein